MSSSLTTGQAEDLANEFADFVARYYKEDVGRLAQHYPKDRESLWVDWADLSKFDARLADDYLQDPDRLHDALEDALTLVDIPLDIDLSGAHVRVYNLDDTDIFSPPEIRSEHGDRYVGIQGTLDRITGADDRPLSLTWECQRCGHTHEVPQTGDETQEPYQCQSCERQGPFTEIDGEWTDYSKLRIKVPPSQADGGSEHIDGYVQDDLVDYGGEHGLVGRAGQNVIAYGVLERVEKNTGDAPLYEKRLRVEAIEFDADDDTVDVDKHREEFEALAESGNPVELWVQSLAPELHATDSLEAAKRLSVAYLFGAPRVDIPDGPTYRGDIHMLLVSDFGMGKSTLASAVDTYSPDSVHKSATGLSSDTGLLSAATRDDFGEGQWTIKPGLLVKQNGGHLLLEEVDKTDADLAKMNDALEGKQMVDVEKAGESATYQSRVGLFATGNPVDGRFNPYEPVAEQIGLKTSLLSRFDGIITMQDHADEEQDALIAESTGRAYAEAQQEQYGEREERDQLAVDIPADVGKAWVKHARESVNPVVQMHQIEDIRDWYAGEVRQLNQSFAESGEDGGNMPVPATPRVVENTARIAMAFARVHLREEVTDGDVEAAKTLVRQLVANNWDGEQFDVGMTTASSTSSQQERMDAIKAVVDELEPADGNGGADEDEVVEEAVERTRSGENQIQHDLDSLAEKGELYRPGRGEVRTI